MSEKDGLSTSQRLQQGRKVCTRPRVSSDLKASRLSKLKGDARKSDVLIEICNRCTQRPGSVRAERSPSFQTAPASANPLRRSHRRPLWRALPSSAIREHDHSRRTMRLCASRVGTPRPVTVRPSVRVRACVALRCVTLRCVLTVVRHANST